MSNTNLLTFSREKEIHTAQHNYDAYFRAIVFNQIGSFGKEVLKGRNKIMNCKQAWQQGILNSIKDERDKIISMRACAKTGEFECLFTQKLYEQKIYCKLTDISS